MNLKLILPLLLFSFTSIAQIDTVQYYIDYFDKKCEPEYAYYFRKAWKEDTLWHVNDYYAKEMTLQMEGNCMDDSLKVSHGMHIFYHKNGRVKGRVNYVNGKENGMRKNYNEQGKLVDSACYKQGVLIGYYYTWNDAGMLVTQSTYDTSGYSTGYQSFYYDDGSLEAHGKISGYDKLKDMNIKDSTWSYFDTKGFLTCLEYFDKGAFKKKMCFDKFSGTIPCTYKFNIPKFSDRTLKRMVKSVKDSLQYNCKNLGVQELKGKYVFDLTYNIDGKHTLELVQGISPCVDEMFIREIVEILKRTEAPFVYNKPNKYSTTLIFDLPLDK